MKLILSRKGFDSSAGRMPSPILPDGTLLSLPIPTDADPEFTYGDLQYGQSSYQKIISQLKRTFKDGYCHLDPDLRPEAVARPAGWASSVRTERGRVIPPEQIRCRSGRPLFVLRLVPADGVRSVRQITLCKRGPGSAYHLRLFAGRRDYRTP